MRAAASSGAPFGPQPAPERGLQSTAVAYLACRLGFGVGFGGGFHGGIRVLLSGFNITVEPDVCASRTQETGGGFLVRVLRLTLFVC